VSDSLGVGSDGIMLLPGEMDMLRLKTGQDIDDGIEAFLACTVLDQNLFQIRAIIERMNISADQRLSLWIDARSMK
jgi:hypothetical protein